MLIKYRDVELYGDDNCIKIVEHDNPVVIIQLIKQIDSIMINDDWYEFISSEYIPARIENYGCRNEVCEDVLNVYVNKVYG